MKPKRLARKTIYQSSWIRLHLDEVRLPSGNVIDSYHVLDYPREAVGAIVTSSRDQILMVQAHRYVTDDSGWEIPAGRIDRNESVLEAAQRETREESGYDTVDHELVYTFNPSNGMSNQVVHLVRCRATSGSGYYDTDEIRQYAWFPREEALAMIARGEIRDGLTLIGLLLPDHLGSGTG